MPDRSSTPVGVERDLEPHRPTVGPPPLPLVDEAFETDDIAAAESVVRRVYPVASLRESRNPFWFEQFHRGSHGVTFTRFKFSSWMDIAVEFEHPAFGVVLGGSYSAWSGSTRLDTVQPFLFAPGSGSSRSESLDLLMINIDTEVLRGFVSSAGPAATTRLAFGGGAPASAAMSRHWWRTVRYVWESVLLEPEVFRSELARAAALQSVVAASVAAFPITGRELRDRAADGSGMTAAMRRAVRFIEEHPDAALTVAQIAAAGRMSPRSLHEGFRRELATTPMGYLRRVRLEEAHRELLEADESSGQVAGIARRWGFSHLGRFASDYRAQFDEYPRDTLRR